MAEHQHGRREQLVDRGASVRGFTLVELVVVIVVLGMVSAVVIPRWSDLAGAARVNAAREEMRRLQVAICGSMGPGEVWRSGFEADVGFPPGRLQDLVVRPDTVTEWDPHAARGWNGPYIDDAGGAYLTDPWDSAYVYDCESRTIRSYGGGTDIALSF